MSKVHLVCFADKRMSISQSKLIESARKFGVDEVHAYNDKDLPDWWMRLQADVMKHERGCGYYAWKPWIVADTIHKLEEKDILIYCDAGNELISSVNPIIQAMQASGEDIMLFSNGWPHVDWCKGDTLKYILGWDYNAGPISHADDPKETQAYWHSFKQVQASTMFFRVSKRSKDFVKEWLALSLVPGLVDNEPSKAPNCPTFAEHRWDQSIIGSLAIRDTIPLRWFPTTTAAHIRKEHPGDNYPTLLWHHRRRNEEWP